MAIGSQIYVTKNSRFKNKYTVGWEKPLPKKQAKNIDIMVENVHSVVQYLSNYVSWKGKVIDLGFTWGFNPVGEGGGASVIKGMYEDIVLNKNRSNGEDQFEGGAHIDLDSEGKLTLGTVLYDLSSDITEPIDSDRSSFWSMFLHELLHSMGLIYVEKFDETEREIRNGILYITSPKVLEIFPGGIPVDPAHYITDLTAPQDEMLTGGIMYEGKMNPDIGWYISDVGKRMQLGQIDLALLHDLGYKVYLDKRLPIFDTFSESEDRALNEQIDKYLNPEPDNPLDDDNIIYSVRGKGELRGGAGADEFAFDSFDKFSKKGADKIIDFNSAEGDFLGFYNYKIPRVISGSQFKYAKTSNKKELKLLSKENYDFVYFEKKGQLFYDANGYEKGWGRDDEGGLIAIFKGKPELSINDIVVWS